MLVSRKPIDPIGAKKIQSRDVAATLPADGETLIWIEADNSWEPGTIDTGVQVSSDTPHALGSASAGSSSQASRSDHVHALPSAASISAVPTSRTVTVSSPLTGGGALSSDISIGLSTPIAVINGGTGSDSASAARAALGVQDSLRRESILSGSATSVTASGYDAVGYYYFSPTENAISGRTLSLTLEAIGMVVYGVTGTIVLYDLTNSSTAATLSWTETSATRKTASVTLPVGNTTYELRLSKSGGAVDAYVLVGGVNVLKSWS